MSKRPTSATNGDAIRSSAELPDEFRIKLNRSGLLQLDSLELETIQVMVDPLAQKAIRSLVSQVNRRKEGPQSEAANELNPYEGANKSKEEEIREFITQKGLTGVISSVNQKINNSRLNVVQRKLISEKALYSDCLEYAWKVEKVNERDENGIFQAALRRLGTLTSMFYWNLAKETLESHNINYNTIDDSIKNILLEEIISADIPITAGQPAAKIMNIFNKVMKEGPLRMFVQKYLEKGEVSSEKVTDKLVSSMVSYLKRMNIVIPSEVGKAINNGSYDEYFALALDYAYNVESGGEDPIDQIRNKGSESSWDFSVNTFEEIEEQGVTPKNILAAGALYYVYVLGEQLNMFKLANSLILKWANGQIDITDAATESKLYRFYKLNEERASTEERGMLYKRVLNLGEANLLSGTVVNIQFSRLWKKLMTEVVDYITKTETSSNKTFVSKLSLYQVIKEIQYNLTSHMTGMAHIQVTEMYNHLQEAIDIMSDNHITQQVAQGRTKNLWSVVDLLHQDVFGTSANITAYKTAAVQGYNLIKMISEFNESLISETEFNNLILTAESYILALGEEGTVEPVERVEEDEFAEIEDEFENWDE